MTSAATVRPAAVAGTFYPGESTALHAMIQQMLDATSASGQQPKIIVAPHAGYIYSGPVAASIYKRLLAGHDSIHRVLLLGPSHRVPLAGMATSSADFYSTPLGKVAVDKEANALIEQLPGVVQADIAHQYEHSLEVHLPFLQTILDDFTLVPVVVGDAQPAEVAAVINALWGGDETLVVISSDLSHYHDYAACQQLDNATTEAIMQLRGEDIGYDDACGRNPLRGAIEIARQKHMRPETVDLRNSGDTAGPRDQVVGYGAYAFYE